MRSRQAATAAAGASVRDDTRNRLHTPRSLRPYTLSTRVESAVSPNTGAAWERRGFALLPFARTYSSARERDSEDLTWTRRAGTWSGRRPATVATARRRCGSLLLCSRCGGRRRIVAVYSGGLRDLLDRLGLSPPLGLPPPQGFSELSALGAAS
jgi:hypothetical protein